MYTPELSEITDLDERADFYEEMFQYINDQAYVIYGYMVEGTYAMSADVDWEPWTGVPYTKMTNAQPAG